MTITSRSTLSSETYVLRLWREGPDGSTWAGRVQHARTEQVVYIHDAEELLAYLQDQIEQLPFPPPGHKGLK